MKAIIRCLIAITLLVVCCSAYAYAWTDENNALTSDLSAYTSWTVDAENKTAVAVFENEWIQNTSSEAKIIGLYYGWMWVGKQTDPYSAHTPLVWDNSRQAFYTDDFAGTSLEIKVERLDAPISNLLLSEVSGSYGGPEDYVGVPWSFGGGAPAIATQADWNVPFIDLGVLAPGETKYYGIKFTYTFGTSEAASQLWYAEHYGWTVSEAVPEPSSLLALGTGILAFAPFGLRRRK